MDTLLNSIRSCEECQPSLSHPCRPIVSFNSHSQIIIIGQAPGKKVQASGIPWDDVSGDNLRKWMDVNKEEFYNPSLFGIMPMGFCYPGKGKSGDLPPRKECAPLWHDIVLKQLKNVKLVLLIGQYAQKYYLQNGNKKNLTATVQSYKEFLPKYFALPHPSPRNFIWQNKNPWFQELVLPELKRSVLSIISE